MRHATAIALVLAAIPSAGAAPLSYNRDVRPILSENCFSCHGPDKSTRKAKLRLDLREAALGRKVLKPGEPDRSELVYRITTDDQDDLMPPPDSHKALTGSQKKTLHDWIAQGADYQAHWAYLRPVRPPVPEMGEPHPVDNFILEDLNQAGLTLSKPAAAHTLTRRLSFDLTGLPPQPGTPADPDALTGRLLASPQFGERMAVFWLDLARYADSAGYHSDKVRDVTPYRDYVIGSFNNNKPYDRFIIEQLAGDLLENPATEHYIATAFNRVNQLSEEGGIQDAEYISKYYAERVRTTSVAFLGSTMGCAECHDHKFDPFTTTDFYSMEAFFADIFEKGAYNGDGRFNEGARIEDYPGFKLVQWGPAMDVPEPDQARQLARIGDERKAAEADLAIDTPELESAFLAWISGLRTKSGSREPQDVTILDDGELPLGGARTVTDNVHSGSLARHQQSDGLVQHIVDAAKAPVPVASGDKLYAWVWLDPKDPPKQLMLQFHVDKSWEHRAWWGEDLIPYGNGGNKAAHHRAGELPPSGRWVRLEVEAAKVGIPAGRKITQLAYTQHGGTVLWDDAGRRTDDPHAVLAGLPDQARKALADSGDKPLAEDQRGILLAHYRSIAPALEPVRQRIARLGEEEMTLRSQIRSTLVTLAAKPREVRVLPRGNWMDKSGEVVLPSVPAFLISLAPGPAAAPDAPRQTRLDLARWIASPDNPLTARAFVNRLWALFFGSGLSRDLQDLGNQGRWPTHPELLDWLAVEFMDSGWDVKHMVRLIVTSKAYQQSSNPSPGLLERDPYNELYARQNARRLPAEFVRDNALAISGLLNRQLGGASARPYQPAGYYAQLNFPKREYQQHTDANQYRRGLYMHWQRSFLHPMLAAFDAPAREECTAYRESSNTPLQALDLLNDPTFVEAARVFAENLILEHGKPELRIESAFQQLLSRTPTTEETELLTTLYQKQLTRYRAAPDDAKALLSVGLAPACPEMDPAELAATTALTRALLNLHETITRY